MIPAPATRAEIVTLLQNAPAADAQAVAAARAHDAQLTKPAGALGRLEEIAFWLAAWQKTSRPVIAHPQIVIFAGNHGVCAQGISAFPPEVTAQMVANFHAGGAAINQLAAQAGARMDVIALDLDRPTADFTRGPAMDEAEFIAAFGAGWESIAPQSDLLICGEMGIGNTTAAAAIAHALCGGGPEDWVGRGTGLDDAGLARKADVIARGLAANPEATRDPVEALRCLGGREIVAMAGAMAHARTRGLPVLLDGYIATAAAAALGRVAPAALDHIMAAHQSAEAAHGALLAQIGKVPLLDLGLRLGEGTGAALGILIVKAALACHNDMASFAAAGVAQG